MIQDQTLINNQLEILYQDTQGGNDQVSDLINQINMLETEKDAQLLIISQINQDISSEQAILNNLNTELNANTINLESVNLDITNNINLVNSYSQDITEFNNQISSIENSIVSENIALDSIISDISLTENSIAALNADISLIQNQIVTLNQEINDLSNQLADLQNAINQLDLTFSDSVMIYVNEKPDEGSILTVNKKVFIDNQWADSGIFVLEDIIRFQITISNLELSPIDNVVLKDILPENIISYYDVNNGNVNIPDRIENNNLYWYFEKIDGLETKTIEFETRAQSVGIGSNIANVSNFSIFSSQASKGYNLLFYDQDKTDISIVETLNQAPIAETDNYEIQEGEILSIENPGILENDKDDNPESLMSVLEKNVLNGTLDLHSDGSFSYIPNDKFSGHDSFTYKAFDGELYSNIALVKINIKEIIPDNTPPIANDDHFLDIIEDSENNILDVLANDTDIDVGDIIRLYDLTQPENGNVILLESGYMNYTPNHNFFGYDNFSYTIIDQSGETSSADVYLKVININDKPNAFDDALYTRINTAKSFDVLANDIDYDYDDLIITDISEPLNGTAEILSNMIYYTPETDFLGVNTIYYNISDGNGEYDIGILNITVDLFNTDPNAKDDSAYVKKNSNNNEINVLENDSDSDGDSLIIDSILTHPSNGIVSLSENNVLYTPNPNYLGEDSFEYIVTDNLGGYDSAKVKVNVEENFVDFISKPVNGSLYILNQEINKIELLLDLFETDVLCIGPISFELNIDETKYFPVEEVKYYLNGELIDNVTENPFEYTFNQRYFGRCTIKAEAFGNGQSISDELDMIVFNFGLTSESEDNQHKSII